jgi:hypothetical protein
VIIRSAHPAEIDLITSEMHYDPSRKVNSVALLDSDTLIACALYDHWTYNSVNVHIWSKSPQVLYPLYISEIFRYPFEVCSRGILLAVTPADNENSLKFSKALGFREVYRVKDGWKEGVDLVVKEMRREECQWLLKKVA